jgi:hypothetical protein
MSSRVFMRRIAFRQEAAESGCALPWSVDDSRSGDKPVSEVEVARSVDYDSRGSGLLGGLPARFSL